MKTKLDAIQARADAATEGPWHIQKDCEEDYEAGIVYAEWPQTLVGPQQAHPSTYAKERGDTRNIDEINELTFPDAVFIAHAREDVPKLVAALRAVEAVASKWEAEYKDSALNWELMEGVDAGLLIGLNQAAEEARAAIRQALG